MRLEVDMGLSTELIKPQDGANLVRGFSWLVATLLLLCLMLNYLDRQSLSVLMLGRHNQEKSKDFYVRILGGKVIKQENPCYIKLANSWIILNSGGGPTPDKPQVLLETPSDLNRVNSFLNLRVADIWTCHKQWRDKGAFFLTEPLDNHGLGVALLHA